jgi:hypothetical protein
MSSIAARHITTWDNLYIDPGPDRLVLVGETATNERISHSSSLGIRYDQIDQLIIDLLTARAARSED